MHKHVRSNYQNPSQNFLQKHKNIKFPPPPKKKKKKKTWKPRSTCMKYMKKEKGEIKRTYQVQEVWIRMKMKREKGF